ncbi:MAG TPA: ADOP family duplicated permease [Bryobacteraceae bacterium]
MNSLLRGFRRSPGVALLAAGTIAIGIGAATAVFSAVDPLLFRPLPYPRADRLVSFGFFGPIDNNEFHLANSYLDWRDRQTVFQAMTSMFPGTGCDLDTPSPRQVSCFRVEANFLHVLGVAPALGRDFLAEENRFHGPQVGLLSYALWKNDFGGDAGILEQTVSLDDQAVRIVGVLPANFKMPQGAAADILLLEQWNESTARLPTSTILLRAFARLKDGVSIAQARERLQPLFRDSVNKFVPAELRPEARLVVQSLRDRQIHEVKLASWMLLGAVLALLLLACANVANLLLARAAARRGEWAMRAALGATRGRLIRQALAESSMLGLAGGAAGVGAAFALLRLFVAIAPSGLAGLEQARVDTRVLCFALIVSLFSAIVSGLAPALDRPRAESLAGWRSAGFSPVFRNALVAMQVGLSLVLLTGASLFARSLQKLETQDLGFRPERVVAASFTLRRHKYDDARARLAFYRELERRLKAIPGAGVFALTDSIPPRGSGGRPYSNMRIAGHPPLAQNGGMVDFRTVSPDYFRALGIDIVAGRGFQESDRTSGPPPIVLSATLARRMFGGENPVGQEISLDEGNSWSAIVGIAGDAKNNGVSGRADPEYYRLRMNDSPQLGRNAVAIFRTTADPAALARAIGQEMAALDSSLPATIDTLAARVDRFSEQPRFTAALVSLFAVFGLGLAAVGLYGVLSFAVSSRTREIGIRMAIGATPSRIALLIEKQGASMVGAGLAAGLIAAAALAKLVQSLLFEISPEDPASLAGSIAVLTAAAALAAWIPARRAARVDPMAALRRE